MLITVGHPTVDIELYIDTYLNGAEDQGWGGWSAY